MKKIILTSAVLMAFAATTYAQLINQQGQQQYAAQNQFGQGQTGTINQDQTQGGGAGRSNYGNYAITFQGYPQNTGINTLLINQNGGSQGNRAGITQAGGPGNDATISQSGGDLGLSGGATSTSATIGAAGEDGNFAGIAQIGSLNTALITQDNNSRRNNAETYQNGSTNQARTRQSNNAIANKAYVYQGYSGPNIIGVAVNNAIAEINQGKGSSGDVSDGQTVPESVGNTAIVVQTASNTNATIFQGATSNGTAGRAEGSVASISQSRVFTNAAIYQGVTSGESIGSKASIVQTGANTIAQIVQGSGVNGSDNASTATITQAATGPNFPTASITQGAEGASDGDQATITQTGTAIDGTATINQGVGTIGGSGSYSSGDKASLTQLGNSNSATINQNSTDGSAGGQSSGRNNTATLSQATSVNSGGVLIDQGLVVDGSTLQTNRNTATIEQASGTGVRARILQGGTGTASLYDAFFAPLAGNVLVGSLTGPGVSLIGTVSNDNTASISQSAGDNHNANIFQTGRFNTAVIGQSGGNGAQALIVQTSNSQRAWASISQSAPGTDNVATIYQFTGSNADGVGQYGNMASISQTLGSANTALIEQGDQGSGSSSNDNLASISQNGSGNTTRFLQTGNNNFADITQNGIGNLVTGLAPGSTFASQVGYNNRLTLVQNCGNGPGLTFRYTQVGNNNTLVINQNY